MKKSLFTLIFILAALIISAQIRIDTPVLTSPDDGDDNQMPDVMLDWDAVTAGVDYQLQLSEDSSFSTFVIDSITDLTSVKTQYLNFYTEYFWQVRAIDIEGNTSFWTPVRTFTTFEKLDLKKPSDGSDGKDPDEELSWKDRVSGTLVTGVEHFDIQLDTIDTFDSPYFLQVSTNGSTFKENMDQLLFDTEFFWRVRARHSNDESEWSVTWSFSTLNQFNLKKPADASTYVFLNVLLRWDDVSGVKKYDYQLDDDPDFSSPSSYVTDTFRIDAEELKFGITYNWRVRARHDFDTTLWTDVWTFTTAGNCILLEPENGADSLPLKPQLKWEEIEGVASYEILYSADSVFTDVEPYFLPADDDVSPVFNILYKLDPETEYYWKVRACSVIDTSDFSDVWTFTTIPDVGIDEYLFNSSSVNIYPNPAGESIRLVVNLPESAEVECVIMDILGQTLYRENFSYNQGENVSKIDLNYLSNGVYLIKLKSGNSYYTNKLLINK